MRNFLSIWTLPLVQQPPRVKRLSVRGFLIVLRRQTPKILVALASFGAVIGIVLVQQVRQVDAAGAYQTALQDGRAEFIQANAIGLTSAQIADLRREETSAEQARPPSGSAPFNAPVITFYQQQTMAEKKIETQLRQREAAMLGQARSDARQAVDELASGLHTAAGLGVDQGSLAPLQAAADSASSDYGWATTIPQYQLVSAQLSSPLQTLKALITDQEAMNALVQQYIAQVSAQDHGDPAAARQAAQTALAQVQTDLATAAIFHLDTSLTQANVQRLNAQLLAAQSLTQLEQVTAGFDVRDHQLQQAMATSLPEKAITVSLKEQVLRAYLHGQLVYQTFVTTGRPNLETDPGTFKVYSKTSPFTMHSPWPKGSPFWYPDTKVQTAMWFNGGDAIHDAWWRSVYGPGTEYPHYDPTGEDNGTHGCVNVPTSKMPWLWSWTPVGTPVIVY